MGEYRHWCNLVYLQVSLEKKVIKKSSERNVCMHWPLPVRLCHVLCMGLKEKCL